MADRTVRSRGRKDKPPSRSGAVTLFYCCLCVGLGFDEGRKPSKHSFGPAENICCLVLSLPISRARPGAGTKFQTHSRGSGAPLSWRHCPLHSPLSTVVCGPLYVRTRCHVFQERVLVNLENEGPKYGPGPPLPARPSSFITPPPLPTRSRFVSSTPLPRPNILEKLALNDSQDPAPWALLLFGIKLVTQRNLYLAG